MKKIALLIGVLTILLGAYFLLNVPKATVVVPESANAAQNFGYIKGFDTQHKVTTFVFDEARWLAGNEAADTPNGFGIKNESADYVVLTLAPKVQIEIVDLNIDDDALRDISLDEFKSEFLTNPEYFIQRVFWLTFDANGLVDHIKEQYVP